MVDQVVPLPLEDVQALQHLVWIKERYALIIITPKMKQIKIKNSLIILNECLSYRHKEQLKMEGVFNVVAPHLTELGNQIFENSFDLRYLYAPKLEVIINNCFTNCSRLQRV